MHFDGKMKNNRRKIERGLGILPYGNLLIQDDRRRWENFACVMTQAVLAIRVFRHSRRVCRIMIKYKKSIKFQKRLDKFRGGYNGLIN